MTIVVVVVYCGGRACTTTAATTTGMTHTAELTNDITDSCLEMTGTSHRVQLSAGESAQLTDNHVGGQVIKTIKIQYETGT